MRAFVPACEYVSVWYVCVLVERCGPHFCVECVCLQKSNGHVHTNMPSYYELPCNPMPNLRFHLFVRHYLFDLLAEHDLSMILLPVLAKTGAELLFLIVVCCGC